MKRKILIAVLAMISSYSFGQISISVEGTPNMSGTPFTFTSAGATVDVNALINNTSSGSINIEVERVMINPLSSWIDHLCWATSSDGGLTGQCYDSIQVTNPYTTPQSYVIEPGDNGIFKASIVPSDPDYGCGEYRYYFIQNGTVILDSIDVIVCKTVSVDELAPALSISVAPNPASSYFKVKTNNIVGATVQVVDVLGNIVLKETVLGSSKTISTEGFRNGVYFVRVTANNQRTIIRKVIVRH